MVVIVISELIAHVDVMMGWKFCIGVPVDAPM